MKTNKLIILCATQRCGSTMIVEDLRNTNVMGKAEEYFIPWLPEKDIDWLESFNSILKRSQTSNGISAIKVMANQLDNIEKCLSTTSLLPNESGMYPYIKALFKNATFIRIKRDGIIRQAISRVIAKKTGVNHALHDKNVEYKPGNLLQEDSLNYSQNIKYNNDEIDAEVINIAKESMLWDEVFKSWNLLSPLELHYEQVCRAYPNYIKRVAKYVMVEVDLTNVPKNRNIKQLSNEKNNQLVSSYLNN